MPAGKDVARVARCAFPTQSLSVYSARMQKRIATLWLLGLSLAGCGGAAGVTPVAPLPVDSLEIGTPSPSTGATIVISTGTPPGAFILKGSGQLTVPITLTSARDLPYAQLYVFLLSGSDYCGQNLPDAPTWSPLRSGRTESFNISGFQVYRLPCEVTGVRVMLHTRNSGLLTPPGGAETVIEKTLAVRYQIKAAG